MARYTDIQIITAESILGLKPTGVEMLASTLLSNGLSQMLSTRHPVVRIPTLNHLYSNQRDPYTHLINGEHIKDFSLSLHTSVTTSIQAKSFALVLGGDCSILIGILSALKPLGTYGLIFMDAHADFYQPEKSTTGEVADMDLAFVTGRGPDILANINQSGPYVKEEHVLHIGQRDMDETRQYGSQEIRSTRIGCFDLPSIQKSGMRKTVANIKQFTKQIKTDGFWIHFDTDVISDEENPAVDYRLAGGLSFEQCELLLNSFLQDHEAVGMSVTIFNPNLDKQGAVATRLTNLISRILNGRS
jgi:arginase